MTRSTRLFGAVMAIVTGLVLVGSASAAPFTNGSFESPGGAPIRAGLANGSTFVTGWLNNGGFQIYESEPNDGVAAAGDGVYWVSFGHSGATGGTFRQTFDTVVGTSYAIDYLLLTQQGPTTESMRAEVFDGATSLGFVTNTFASLNVWLNGPTLNFVAASTSTTLVFTDITGAEGGPTNWGLDNVTLAVTSTPPPGGSVPEPRLALLLGAAVVGLGAARRALRK